MKLNVPKRVTLPNDRTFVACYKIIPRDQLPSNIVMRRTHKQLCQEAEGVDKEDAEFFIFSKKAAQSPSVKPTARKGLEYATRLYHNLTKRVKNKTLKRILNSDAAHLALNKAIKTADNHLR